MTLPPPEEIRNAMVLAMENAGGGPLHTRNQLEPAVAQNLRLSDEDRSEMSRNGTSVLQNKIDALIGSADRKLGYFESVEDKLYKLTAAGRVAASALKAADGPAREFIDDSALAELVEEFKRDFGYEREEDRLAKEDRKTLATGLSRETLDGVLAEPERFGELNLGKLAGNFYGSAGQQAWINRSAQEGEETCLRIVRTLKYVLYDDELPVSQRLDDALTLPEWKVRGLSEVLLVKALAVVYPESWLPLFVYTGAKGKKTIMQISTLGMPPLDEATFTTAGVQAFVSNNQLKILLDPVFPGDPWGQMRFLYWLLDREKKQKEPAATQAAVGEVEPSPIKFLADSLLISRDWLQKTIEMAEHKRQLIFYGPPGTGKTYVARAIAKHLAVGGARVELVQFHPSYTYEDFVEGFRPKLADSGSGTVQFELRPGPLREIAKLAEKSPDERFVIIIDEINRANIAKVFGELYYLLEYRDQDVRLQYGDSFSLPHNIYFIGTMNTADRSIALLDAALRRRFFFVPFFPDEEPVKGLLRRWLGKHRPEMIEVAALVDQANAKLPDRSLHIGPSYFMDLDLNEEWLTRIWEASVLPYIEEQFFDERNRVSEFRLDQLRKAKNGSDVTIAAGGAGDIAVAAAHSDDQGTGDAGADGGVSDPSAS
jgi:5-methylcytosine-specific restriction enzyme B